MAPAGHHEEPCVAVKSSAEWVLERAQLVSISQPAIGAAVAGLDPTTLRALARPAAIFDRQLHLFDPERPDLTVQAMLVVDALNFCFWPEEGLEYEHLASGVKAAALADPGLLTAASLAAADAALVQRLFGCPGAVPLEQQRIAALREVGRGLAEHWGGQAAALVRAAGGSASRLVALVLRCFPSFRDECTWHGRRLCFYKRAQIFAADVWGLFGGQGLGALDPTPLTMFADYRVPVVLRERGILQYAPALAASVDGRRQLAPGSDEEVEIRAATIAAVERLRAAVQARLACEAAAGAEAEAGAAGNAGSAAAGAAAGGNSIAGVVTAAAPVPEGEPQPRQQPAVLSIAIDWWLWEEGERQRSSHRPHHLVLTTFY